MPKGYRESFRQGMIMCGGPLSRYPNTYNKQPLCFVALAAQKNYGSLYLMGCFGDAGQRAALKCARAVAGGKLDMGQSCGRFAKATKAAKTAKTARRK